ncbi:unnamed protein product [Discula destructiva]
MTRRDEFDAIFVIQADNPAKILEQFCRIAPALGLLHGSEQERKSEEADLVVNRSKVLKWLSSPKFSNATLDLRNRARGIPVTREANWLLIFDNFENSATLRDYWPFGSTDCILVTTRDARVSNLQRHITQIDLDRLDTGPASSLFLQLSQRVASDSNNTDVAKIVDRLGGLPLAIEQAAAYVYRIGLTLREFLTVYDKTLLQKRKDGSSTDSWSYELVASWALDGLRAPAAVLLRVYSFLDPDRAQDSLLTDSIVRENSTLLPPDYPEDQLMHIDARGEMLKSSLIRANLNATPVTIRMHRLVQDISLSRMSTSQIVEVFSLISLAIHESWPFTANSWDHQAGVWSIQEALLQHIFRLSQIATTYNVSELEIPSKRRFIELLSSGGW